MLQWPLVSFWDLFAAGKRENQQTSCRGIASGASKMISLGSDTPTDLSPDFFNRKWNKKNKYCVLNETKQRTNNLTSYAKDLHSENKQIMPFSISAGLNCWVLVPLKTMRGDGVQLTGILIHIDRGARSK